MSPRRSSRARTTQPPPAAPPHTHSSTSSSSSGRAERSTRSHHKVQSPQRSVHPRSESTEEIQDAQRSDPPQTRQRKRDLGEDKDELPQINAEGDDDEGEEEEITRCICEHLEYPGLPVPLDPIDRRNSKSGSKEARDPHSSTTASETLPDDAGGLFIQCDACKVWQHGGCVGIMDVAMSPEEYFCEKCRPDLHMITVGANGQKFSRYLPLYEEVSPRTSPSPSIKDPDSRRSKDPKSSRPSAISLSTKRRSTMNSRDAAYDEEEQLRIAIEESKGEGKEESGERRGKRGRSDSEDTRQDAKRQRTTSGSPSNPSNPNTNSTSQRGNSDDGSPSNKEIGSGVPKKIKGAAARNHRENDIRDREAEREKARADAAGRRKGRAERRRGDDSDPSDEYPLSRTTSAKGADGASQTMDPPVPSQAPPETPPINQEPPAKTSHRKNGKPSSRRGRVGRNQYTKDRDQRNDTNGDQDGSSLRSQSRDINDDNSHSANGTHTNGESGKPSKPRYMNPHRTSMNEMKRRVAAILEFISRTQLEMAGEQTPPNGGGGGGGASALIRGLAEGLGPMIGLNGENEGSNGEKAGLGNREFAELSSMEMMDVLTRKLVLWQKEFGKYGEK
ncbi:MAG: hypothetical protein M1830_009107 [Pleopsidium flavum]|nr:MAG: hypothetical protein M1830_009107 [Pleopsidium flavum]